MTEDPKIRAAWEAHHGPGDGYIPDHPDDYERGYRDGYAAAKAEASADIARASKALARCEDWRERYLSTPVDGYQPIDDGSKAVPPGDE